MDYSSSDSGSQADAVGTPLRPLSHNQQRDTAALFASARRNRNVVASAAEDDARDSSVHEKITQFNTLAMQSKQLERKTADAALKRAMLGREEAETEMRRYRDEARLLKKHVEEGKERERRVGERLETVMENYGRAKETHAHTQALWEKEIRRARKETFKSQSVLVKVQEELKSCRTSQKVTEEELVREKERSKAREQEAFAARYTLVGVQEQLDQALERVKVLEQERDAFKMLAKEEEVARIAAEGRLPLPPSRESPVGDDGEFASPQKHARESSVSIVDIKSSAASEAEMDELSRLWLWEKQRADRALEHVEFLEAECTLRCCPVGKAMARSRSSLFGSSTVQRKQPARLRISDAGDLVILSEGAPVTPASPPVSPRRSKTERLREDKEMRRSTIFVPSEGIFRTVSQAETSESAEPQKSPSLTPTELPIVEQQAPSEPPTPENERPFLRTPSVDPPDFAIATQTRTSLLSLLDAPHRQEMHIPMFDIPTTPGPDPSQQTLAKTALESEPASPDATPANHHQEQEHRQQQHQQEVEAEEHRPEPRRHTHQQSHPRERESTTSSDRASTTLTRRRPVAPRTAVSRASQEPPASRQLADAPVIRPHTSAAHYNAVATVTTTTKVPLRGENRDPNMAARLARLQRTPSHGEKPSFDVNNPALTPTMTREEALAQIRERRGRARSVVAGAVTPRKPMVEGVVNTGSSSSSSSNGSVTSTVVGAGVGERIVSAPTARVGGAGVSVVRRVRS
ncbi:hypothetical protein B0T17DRAFT_586215 [Bombardia bombarda]|uniref:Uncharacterized protein n=1 Tax=Bombardia bombarda TaxID=252184 RepID=A0AA40CEE0_9PEZI|nr:hypothetical protein B0T17DRAFT_586215 [Bombardia bombarda]